MTGLLRLIASTAIIATAAPVSATLLDSPPTNPFDMPAPGDYYQWMVDLSGYSQGDVVLNLEVIVPPGGADLVIFQVFTTEDMQTCGGSNSGLFDLEVDQPGNSTWNYTDFGTCYYHNYEGVMLDEGMRNFVVTLTNSPGDRYADVRFGDTDIAVPLPGGLVSLATALAVLTLRRRRRSV